MKSKTELMQIIQKSDFALYDLTLYLDTHPKCKEAMGLFAKYKAIRENAVEEYTKRFGPLTAFQSMAETKWDWGKGPQPWEREAN